MCSPSCSPILSLCVSLCGLVEWAHTHHHHLGGVYFERTYSTCTYCICLGTACVGPALRNVSSRGCRKTWSTLPGMIMRLCICIIVFSQIHEAYLITATDPITCWLKGQQHWVKRGQERASRDMVSGKKRKMNDWPRRPLRGKTVTQPARPPRLASLFPSSRHLFVCDSSK